MAFKQMVSKIVPSFLKTKILFWKESNQLNKIHKLEYKIDALRQPKGLSLDGIFNYNEIERIWRDSEKEISQFIIPYGTGGSNPGDRRAIYYLINAFE